MLCYALGPNFSFQWCTRHAIFCNHNDQAGELRLAFSFSFPQPWLIFFGGNYFFSSPPMPNQVSPTYLNLDYLPMHPDLLPPPPTYPSTHLPTYLCTYTLNLHQGDNKACQRGYCNVSGRLLCCPSYLPSKPCNFVTIENNVVMTCNDANEGIATKLNFFSITL